jgi:uncharacterized protein
MKLAIIVIVVSQLLTSAAWARDLNKEYKKMKIKVGSHVADVYIADTPERRESGLMFTKTIGKNEGMIFVFEEEQPLAFWMKNTLIPLSIGYFDKKGVLVDVQEMKVANSIMDQRPPSYTSKSPAQFALEMNPKWFATNKIKLGAKLSPIPSAGR